MVSNIVDSAHSDAARGAVACSELRSDMQKVLRVAEIDPLIEEKTLDVLVKCAKIYAFKGAAFTVEVMGRKSNG